MHDEPMLAEAPRESILRAFAARAGAELEREPTVELLQISEFQAREQLTQLELLYNDAPLGLCYMDTDQGLSPSRAISQLWDHGNDMSTSSQENNRGRYS